MTSVLIFGSAKQEKESTNKLFISLSKDLSYKDVKSIGWKPLKEGTYISIVEHFKRPITPVENSLKRMNGSQLTDTKYTCGKAQ